MKRFGFLLLTLASLLSASTASAVANFQFTGRTPTSADAACDRVLYAVQSSATFTTDDSGTGFDLVAFVWSDGAGNILRLNDNAVSTQSPTMQNSPEYSYGESVFSGFIDTLPLVVRAYDVTQYQGQTPSSLQDVLSHPMVGELRINPTADFPACGQKSFGDPGLRIWNASSPASQFFTAPTTLQIGGELDGGRGKRILLAEPGNLVALFKAKCSNDAADRESWVNLDILVDGAPLPATNSLDAFCTSNGIAGHDGWVSARLSGATFVGRGVHSVAVLGRSAVGGTSAIVDADLTVMVPEPSSMALLATGSLFTATLAIRRRAVCRGRTRARDEKTRGDTARRIPRSSMSFGTASSALCLALAILFTLAPTAEAKTLLEGTRYPANQTFVHASGLASLQLGTGTQFSFAITRFTKLAIFVTAECAVAGADEQTWLELGVYLDGQLLGGQRDAVCSSNGGAPTIADQWVQIAHGETIELGSESDFGSHSIEVRGILSRGPLGGPLDPNTQWWIGDLSLSLVGYEF